MSELNNYRSIAENTSFVTLDGEYGTGAFIFSPNDLTEQQWQVVSEMPPSDRFDYVVARIRVKRELASLDEMEKQWLDSLSK